MLRVWSIHVCVRACGPTGCTNNGPLGMTTGEIRSTQISASSNYPPEWDRGCSEKHARVYQPGDQAWCAKYKSASEWLQVDLGVPAKVGLLLFSTSHILTSPYAGLLQLGPDYHVLTEKSRMLKASGIYRLIYGSRRHYPGCTLSIFSSKQMN